MFTNSGVVRAVGFNIRWLLWAISRLGAECGMPLAYGDGVN